MHMVIRAIVYAKDEEEALRRATAIFEELCKGQYPWGKLLPVLRADSPKGHQLVEEGMQFTKEKLYRNLGKVRKGLAKLTDEDIFEERNLNSGIADDPDYDIAYDGGMLKHFAYSVGKYNGSSVWLYDNDGSGIKSPEQLADTLNKYSCLYEDRGKLNPYTGLDVWVVPADVHY